MDIIVCVKQVPDTNEVKIDPKTGTLIRDGVPSIINPEDKTALEAALRLKEEFGGTVTVLSMGPKQAEDALREALAMGADEAILVSDRAFAGADTLATSYTLAKSIEKIARFDLIFCGRQAIDGDTAQVGPEIAEQLGIPQVSYVKEIAYNGDRLEVKRALEDGYAVVETPLPALLTVVSELNEPRYPSVKGIVDAFKKEITVWTVNNLPLETSKLGLEGSPTQVVKTFSPTRQRAGEVLQGNASEVVVSLVDRLKQRHLV
jgi:electron transfer flavoprotein beta subunit